MASRAVDIVKKYFPRVTSVQDASRPIAIEVTKGDVRGSKKKDHRACAMARACQRSLAIDGAIISRSRAYLIKGRKATRYLVPASISREITSFDRGASFEPGAYRLNVIDTPHLLNLQKKNSSGFRGNATGKKVAARHVTTGIRVSALSL